MQIEISYEKGEELRFLAHLELMRAFERAVRRAKLPVEHSQGFNPRPRIVHAAALGVGVTSECERAAVRLLRSVPPSEVGRRLSEALPDGLRLRGVRELPPDAKPHYALLDRAEYTVQLRTGTMAVEALLERTADLLGRDAVVVSRRKENGVREVDIRAMIVELSAPADDQLRMELAAGQEAQAKPQEVLEALGLHAPGQPLPRIHKVRHYQYRQHRRGATRRR